jgi:hypothetical protein
VRQRVQLLLSALRSYDIVLNGKIDCLSFVAILVNVSTGNTRCLISLEKMLTGCGGI